MFRKDFHVRSNTAIRGSDRRKLRSNVAAQFPSLPADEVVPNKADMTVMKIFTHADYTVMVYYLLGEPMFFEWEKQLYPSVYLLWKYPEHFPCLFTWPPVLEKMVNGADLMLPGVVVPTSGLPQISKGQLCAICLPNSLAPVAVGFAMMSSQDMIASGMKGKGVQTLHCYRDFLWKHGSKANPPQIDYPSTVQSTQEDPGPDQQSTQVPQDHGSNPLNDSNNSQQRDESVSATGDSATSLPTGETVGDSVSGNGDVEEITEGASAIDIEEEDDIPPAVKMDRLLYQCLLHSLKCKVKKSDLPLLTSSFYKNFILPCCPSNQTLDVKKSSYKKLSKFLQAMQQERLLKVKATGKGVDSVVDIDRSHPDVRAFVAGDDAPVDDVNIAPETSATSKDEDVWAPPEVKEFYQVTSKMLPVLQTSGYRQGHWLTGDEVRKAVTDYVKQNDLSDKTDRRLVVLDPNLHDAVMKKTVNSTTHMKWDVLFQRSFQELTAGYQLLHSNQDPAIKQGVKKGKIQPIEMKTQRKAGNKMVTLITRLETFGIDPKDFSHRLQKGVSASSSVTALPGQKSAGQQPQQVLIQGNQVAYIERLLTEHYQVPRKYIQGLELAPKSGRKR